MSRFLANITVVPAVGSVVPLSSFAAVAPIRALIGRVLGIVLLADHARRFAFVSSVQSIAIFTVASIGALVYAVLGFPHFAKHALLSAVFC